MTAPTNIYLVNTNNNHYDVVMCTNLEILVEHQQEDGATRSTAIHPHVLQPQATQAIHQNIDNSQDHANQTPLFQSPFALSSATNNTPKKPIRTGHTTVISLTTSKSKNHEQSRNTGANKITKLDLFRNFWETNYSIHSSRIISQEEIFDFFKEHRPKVTEKISLQDFHNENYKKQVVTNQHFLSLI